MAFASWSVSLPLFRAMFKTAQYYPTIYTVLGRTRGTARHPTFICIRSEADAQEYEDRVPGLWQECSSGRPTWETGFALFLCPEFLRGGQSPGYPLRQACPGVNANRFHTVPNEPILFGDRAYFITKYLLILENTFGPYQISEDPDVYMNLPLGWSAVEASSRALSYLMYIQRESKICAHCFMIVLMIKQ